MIKISQHIHTRAISADKLNIQSLSAISANLGTVTAGTIRGTTISGNTISGGTITGTTISGTNINGGTIRGARIEGLTIQAENIIGDVVKIYSSQLDRNDRLANIVIPSSPKRRKAYLLPVLAIASKSGENVYLGNDRDEWRTYESSGRIIIKKDNATILDKRISIDRYGYKTVPISTSFEIDANRVTTLSFSIENGGVFARDQEFLFLVGNY